VPVSGQSAVAPPDGRGVARAAREEERVREAGAPRGDLRQDRPLATASRGGSRGFGAFLRCAAAQHHCVPRPQARAAARAAQRRPRTRRRAWRLALAELLLLAPAVLRGPSGFSRVADRRKETPVLTARATRARR
jgi:hypothetical protein